MDQDVTSSEHNDSAPVSSKSNAPVTWSIRGVQRETRLVIEKAAERSGKTIGQFFNDELREAATQILKKEHEPPAKTEDLVSNLVGKLREELKQDQANQLVAIQEALSQRPSTLREWLFGKKN